MPAIAEEESIVQLSLNRSHKRWVGDLLHPERESQAALDELKATMGSMEFAAQYQQAPVPIGGNLIKWSWFKFYERSPTPQPGDKLIVSWDTALSSSQLADYSACIVLLARKGGAFRRRMSSEIAGDRDEDMPALIAIAPLTELSHAGVQHLVGMETCILAQ